MTESDPDPRTLDLFFSPRQVAIIGLSRAAVGAPISILTTLKEFGYQGRITVIDPNIAPSVEYETYAGLDEVPASPADSLLPARWPVRSPARSLRVIIKDL